MHRPFKSILFGAALLGCLAPGPTRADSLHCESQQQSSGYLAVEERGYELFIEAGPSGQATVRLRLTYFNSSSQAMDLVSRLALPAHSSLEELRVRGDHGWVTSQATKGSQNQVAPPAGTWFATLLDDEKIPDTLKVAQIIGTKLAPSSYTSIELVLSVPVQQRMQTQRLCLVPRMTTGAGLMMERRVTVKDSKGAPKRFWIDDQEQKLNGQVLRANDRDCLVWSSKKQDPAALHANFSSYTKGPKNNHFALTLELGPESPRRPHHASVMLDNSTSVQASTFHRGAKLFAQLRQQLKGQVSLWSFAQNASPIKTESWPPKHAPKPGSDLVRSILDWILATKTKTKPNTLIIITDGLLPLPSDPSTLASLEQKLRRRPDLSIILLVDDPVLAQRGVANDHPLLTLASKLGAHLSLQSLAVYDAQDPNAQQDLQASLFSSPKVGRDLRIKLPRGCQLDTPAPQHLISGQVQRVFGSCNKNVSLWARLSVKQGKRQRKLRLKAPRPRPAISHLASAVSPALRDQAQSHGSSLPAWFRRSMAHDSELGFAAAAKVKERHGRLDAQLVQVKLREHLWPRAHACYNHALSRNRRQGGVAQLVIALGKGEVSLVEVNSRSLAVKDPLFLDCLKKAAWKLRVPAALADPVVYRIYYPLSFQRPKNADVGKISEQDALRYEWLIGRSKPQQL